MWRYPLEGFYSSTSGFLASLCRERWPKPIPVSAAVLTIYDSWMDSIAQEFLLPVVTQLILTTVIPALRRFDKEFARNEQLVWSFQSWREPRRTAVENTTGIWKGKREKQAIDVQWTSIVIPTQKIGIMEEQRRFARYPSLILINWSGDPFG